MIENQPRTPAVVTERTKAKVPKTMRRLKRSEASQSPLEPCRLKVGFLVGLAMGNYQLTYLMQLCILGHERIIPALI